MNTGNRRGAIWIRSMHAPYNFPYLPNKCPPPLWGGDTLVCGPCIACAYCRGHAGIDSPPPPAIPRRDLEAAAHPPYFGLYWRQQSPLPAEAKGDKTARIQQPQPEGMQTSMNLTAFLRPRDADSIFEFGFREMVFADWRLSQPGILDSNCPALEPP